MPAFTLVDSPPALAHCIEVLERRPSPSVYLDTEFDPQRDRTTLCLLQLSDGEQVFLVDPLRLDLMPLAGVLGAPGAEWVLHAGRQDVPLVCDALGLATPPRVFDTQVAWALLGPEASVALAYLEFRLLGLRGDKGHQADDWRRRPLPPTQLAYAARDVAHLPALRRLLGERLAAVGRAELAVAASREAVWPEPEGDPAPLT
ncbi:MAG: ribonuclease D, partial [Myxococcales bacterium]